MNKELLIIMVIGSFLAMLYEIFVTHRLSESDAKKANYDCTKCKNWKCYYYYCKRKREELENVRKNR